MKKQTLLNLVKKEIEHLIQHATEEEKDRLCIEILDPESKSKCIYGLMTGYCDSPRAKQLYPKLFNKIAFSSFAQWDRSEKEASYYKHNQYKWFTPLEVYIVLRKANLKSVVSCIKGEISLNELKL